MSVEATDSRGDGGAQGWAAPPSMDVPGHLRDLRGAALPAVGVGLVAFLLVFGLQTLLTPKMYEGTVLGQITTTEMMVGGDAYIEQMRAPFVALAADQNVQEFVLAQFDTTMDRETLAANTKLGPGTAPTMMAVTVRAESPELAGEMARATLVALDNAGVGQRAREMENQVAQAKSSIEAARIRSDEIPEGNPEKSTLDAEINAMVDQLGRFQVTGGSRLQLLSEPAVSSKPVSPQPIASGLVAALAAAILAAEGIVFFRGRMGSKPTLPWARRMARRTGAGFERVAGGPSGLTTRASMMLNAKGGRQTLVLAGAPARVDVAQALPADADLSSVVVADLDGDWWRDVDLSRLSGAVVVTTTQAGSRASAEQAMTRLAGLRVPTELVVQEGISMEAMSSGSRADRR